MKHFANVPAIAICIGLIAWAPVRAENHANKGAKPLSNTHEASCVLLIEQGGDIVSLSTLWEIAESSQVFGEAMREIFGETLEANQVSLRWDELEHDQMGGVEQWTCSLRVLLAGGGDDSPKPAAEELLEATVKRLPGALSSIAKEKAARLREAVDSANETLDQANEQVAKLNDLRQGLLREGGGADLSSDAIEDHIRGLQHDRRELALELAGLKARWQSLQEQIAMIAQRAEDDRNDEIASQLKLVIGIREKELEKRRAMIAQGVAPPMEANHVEIELAQTKMQLARRMEELNHSVGGELLAGLNGDLARVSIEVADVEARLDFVTKELEELRSGRLPALANMYEQEFLANWEEARRSLTQANKQAERLNLRMRFLSGPTITVVGAPNQTED